jgi:hypothetical protein
LLIYTGHGSRVQDQDGDECDKLDETLVAVHGSLTDGTQDVRDDDIYALRLALADQGIHFTYIAESCHSETSSRGPPTLNIARVGFPTGPSERLFLDPAFDSFYMVDSSKHAESAATEAIDAASFVSITAAGDRQLARTLMVDETQWGVLSLAMYRTMLEARGPLTYADLFTDVTEQAKAIDRTLKGTPQTPFLHSEGQDAFRAFLGRDPVPFAIRVLAVEDSGAMLSAGLEAGITVNSMVGFYSSLEELAADSQPVATANVTSSGMGRASVSGVGIERDMYCKVLAPAMDQSAIYVDPRLPAQILARLSPQQAPKSLSISTDFDAALFSVEPSEDGSSVEIHWVREPSVKDVEPAFQPISSIALRTSSGALDTNSIVGELERLVRIHRLESISHHPDWIGIEWSTFPERHADGGPFDIVDDLSNLIVRDSETYFVKVKNWSESELFLHLVEIYESDTGVYGANVIRQSSRPPQPYVRLLPGASHVISSRVGLAPGATREDVTHLWIASSTPMENLMRLVSSQVSQASRDAAPPNPILDMLEDSARSRAPVRGEAGVWAARSFKFSILPAEVEEYPGQADAPVPPVGQESP